MPREVARRGHEPGGRDSGEGAAWQSRELWGRLRQLPSKRWQARYIGPDGKAYSARTEGGMPLTFQSKTDARAFPRRTHAAIERGEWESPEAGVAILELAVNDPGALPSTFEVLVPTLAETYQAVHNAPARGNRIISALMTPRASSVARSATSSHSTLLLRGRVRFHSLARSWTARQAY